MNVHARLGQYREALQHFSPTVLYALAHPHAEKHLGKIVKEVTGGRLRTDADVLDRLASLLPKPELDQDAKSRREADFGETVRLITTSMGAAELPRLVELLAQHRGAGSGGPAGNPLARRR